MSQLIKINLAVSLDTLILLALWANSNVPLFVKFLQLQVSLPLSASSVTFPTSVFRTQDPHLFIYICLPAKNCE